MSTTTTTTITADNLTTLFPDASPHIITTSTAPPATKTNATTSTHEDTTSLTGHDAEQIRLMDEVCIVVSPSDTPLGSASKKTCHLMANINQGLLHRAFSVFLFRPSDKKLLLQQRAKEKITFPGMWTNTCCSHPLAHPAEAGTTEGGVASQVEGVKRAAVRKLEHELGIPAEAVPVEKFNFLTRIHYCAPSDGTWGEHEIDYILFLEADVPLDVNANEVQDTRWVSAQELKQMFEDGQTGLGRDKAATYTPWFRLICEGKLFRWWEALEQGKLEEFVGEEGIQRM